MPAFDIIKKSNIEKTFKVARIIGDFDIKLEHCDEHFKGEIIYPANWQIGLIVGNSGTGKSTIAKQLYADYVNKEYVYSAKSVIDDMPKNKTVDEIEKMFYAVGFGSVPSWLKPYSVLSNGEKMRVNLARALLNDDFVVFDEFTSVVDRIVAQTACIAVNKAIHKTNKKFIAVTCHNDVAEYLQPDWVFDTNLMQMSFPLAHDLKKNLRSDNVGAKNGKNLDVIII